MKEENNSKENNHYESNETEIELLDEDDYKEFSQYPDWYEEDK